MTQFPDKISVRLGPLRTSLARKLARSGLTPSEYLRQLIADDLRMQVPQLEPGNPNWIALRHKTRRRSSSPVSG